MMILWQNSAGRHWKSTLISNYMRLCIGRRSLKRLKRICVNRLSQLLDQSLLCQRTVGRNPKIGEIGSEYTPLF